MVIALFVAIVAPLALGTALMAADRLARPLSHAAVWFVALLTTLASLVAISLAAVEHASIDREWIPEIGLRLNLRVDGISAPLVVLAAAVTLLAVAVSSRQRPKGTPGMFYGSLLVVLGGALAAFTVHDAIGFFIAFEVVLVPMWVLIDRYGDAPEVERRRAGWMFALYTVTGSMLMLAGILVLVVAAGTSDLDRLPQAAMALSFGTKLAAAILMTLGLAVKVPMLGVHAWLPRAHTAAPTAGSMVLAGVMLKLGTYGCVRLVVLTLPAAWRTIAPYVGIVAVAGLVVGALVCLVERDLKRIVAWSSIAHMGFVMLALAGGQAVGLQAALFGNVAHGIIAALLFAVVGALKARRGPVDVETPMRGLRDVDPRLGFAFVVGVAASMGVPGLAGFWGEITTMLASWDAPSRPNTLFKALTLVAAIGAVLTAAYGARMLRAVWMGEVHDDAGAAGERGSEAVDLARTTDLAHTTADPTANADAAAEKVSGPEWLATGALCLACFVLGVAPGLLMHVADHDLTMLLGAAR